MLFPKVNKISVHIRTSKNYVAHLITIIHLIGWIWEKNRFVCVLWLSMHTKSVIEQGFLHEFAFDNKALKTFVVGLSWLFYTALLFALAQTRVLQVSCLDCIGIARIFAADSGSFLNCAHCLYSLIITSRLFNLLSSAITLAFPAYSFHCTQ